MYYILDENGSPVAADLMTWARWFENGNRRLALDDLGARGAVSTVFLGTDHNFRRQGEPVLWESMIFGGPLDQKQWRYTSRGRALRGHAALVKACRGLPVCAVIAARVRSFVRPR